MDAGDTYPDKYQYLTREAPGSEYSTSIRTVNQFTLSFRWRDRKDQISRSMKGSDIKFTFECVELNTLFTISINESVN